MNTRRLGIFGKIGSWALAHKVAAGLVALAIAGTGYAIWQKAASGAPATKYVLAPVSKGSIVSSVSGSGQVAAENQVTVSSLVSGTVTGVYVADGDAVKEGQTLASIDDVDATQAVANAELALENARVAYDKAVKDDQDQATTSAVSDLAKAYQSGYNAIVATAIDLPSIFGGMNDIYYTPSHSPYFSDVSVATNVSDIAAGYKAQAGAALDEAKREYEANFLRYKNVSANSSPSEIVSLLNDTNTTLAKLLSALSSTYSTLDYIQNRLTPVPAQLAADKSAVSGYVTKVNADTTSITDALDAIDTAKTSGTTADLDMKAAQLTVSQDEALLSTAEQTLSNHRVKAPFDGIIAKAIAKKGDIASNGTEIATEVTAQQMVDISLNEVDAAKVAKGDKATLMFDAIDGLTLTGHVTNVDIVGTVSQGVVSYSVQISFDSVDPRVKPGMTVNADIITAVKQDVLVVPSSAVKTSNGASYVQVLDERYDPRLALKGVTSATPPRSVRVAIGASNDTMIEIASGLSEGDQVVVRTVAGTAAAAAPSILNSLGGSRGGAAGGAFRATRGG